MKPTKVARKYKFLFVVFITYAWTYNMICVMVMGERMRLGNFEQAHDVISHCNYITLSPHQLKITHPNPDFIIHITQIELHWPFWLFHRHYFLISSYTRRTLSWIYLLVLGIIKTIVCFFIKICNIFHVCLKLFHIYQI